MPAETEAANGAGQTGYLPDPHVRSVLTSTTRDHDQDILLDPEALSERWGVSKSQIYNLTRDGHLDDAKVTLGKYYRYRLAAIRRFEADGGTAAT